MNHALPFRLSFLMFLQWAVPGSLIPLYSLRLEHHLHFTPYFTAFCCATQPLATFVSSLLAGQLADRWFSAEKILSFCAALAGLLLCLLTTLREPLPVFLATLSFGLVSGPMSLFSTTISFTHLPNPGRQFGPVRVWGTIGWMAIGWAIAVWPGDPLHLGALVAFGLSAYAWTLPHTPPRPMTAPGKRFAPLEAIALVKHPPFAIYCVCTLGVCITFPFTTQNTPFLLKHLGVPQEHLQATLTLAQTTEVVGLFVLPMLLLRLGVRGTMILGLGSWLTAMCILAVGRPVEMVLASLLLNGVFVMGFLIAGQIYVNSLAEGDFRASIQGLIQGLNALGQLLGNLLAGWLRAASGGDVSSTFFVALGMTSALLSLFVLGFRQESPRPETPRGG